MGEKTIELRRRGLRAEYSCYINMMHRCTNPNHKAYPRYGGSGITVDPLWAKHFDYFYLDMGYRPVGDGTRKGEFSLDRIDPYGPYTKSNCRWATRKQQQRNQRSNIRIEYQNRMITLVELAELTGINVATIATRLRRGLSVAQAIVPANYPSGRQAKNLRTSVEKLSSDPLVSELQIPLSLPSE